MISEVGNFANLVLSIFVIVDPFAVVPVYLAITEHSNPASRLKTAAKATWIAMAILIFFTLAGLKLFDVFGITLPAFQVAGGILLLRLGLAQLSAERARVRPEETAESLEKEDVSVFPLATPLLAGPGAISTVVLLSSKQNSYVGMLALILAIATALGLSYLFLRYATYLYKLLGKTGLNILTRIMGIILTAISIQFVLNGLSAAFKNLGL